MNEGTRREATPFELYLRLNAARCFQGKIHYEQTLKRIASLARPHWVKGRGRNSRITEKGLQRFNMMIASRTDKPLLGCSLPKKVQREMHLLPAI